MRAACSAQNVPSTFEPPEIGLGLGPGMNAVPGRGVQQQVAPVGGALEAETRLHVELVELGTVDQVGR